MTKDEVKSALLSLAEEDYRKFSEKLNPSESRVLGVRSPAMRKTAKALAKDGWREYTDSLDKDDSYEEKLAAGMSIYYAKTDINERIEYTEKIMPFIDGWAVCDSICSTIRLKKDEREIFWSYLKECAASGEEFRTRFGLIAMLHEYIDGEHIDDILDIIDNISYNGYYASMGGAWLLADCMVKFPEKTYEYMQDNKLDDWVYNKAITKMRESYRVDKAMKDELKTMMRK